MEQDFANPFRIRKKLHALCKKQRMAYYPSLKQIQNLNVNQHQHRAATI